MSLPFSGPVTGNGSCCERMPGTFPPDLAPYVRSINGLQGIITVGGSQYIDVTALGNAITISLDIDAVIPIILAEENDGLISMEGGITPGIGSVQSVEISSSTLSVGGTNPITTDGTITVNLTGAVASIQGLTTSANKMIYTTASNVYSVTDLTAFARTILDDANGAAVVATIGAQPLSADLTTFVTVASWSGSNLTLSGNLTVTDLTAAGTTIESLTVENISVSDSVTIAGTLGVTGAVTGASFAGVGTALTALNGANITAGAVPAANGGTGHAGGYTIGDLLYATASGTLSKLADVAVGSFLRSGGVATAPAWSATKWPNTLAVGDLLYADTTTNVARLADVATGNALISGGVGVAPSWGKITTAHATGLAGSGNNTNITGFTGTNITFADGATFNADTTFAFGLIDASSSPGTANQVLTSLGNAVQWSSDLVVDDITADDVTLDALTAEDITVDDLIINTTLSTEGTITGAGSTGAVTIDKMSGTCRVAAAGTSVVVTNSLCLTTSRVMAICCTNDSTAYVKNVVVAAGSFTITLGAAATAETEIAFLLFNIT